MFAVDTKVVQSPAAKEVKAVEVAKESRQPAVNTAPQTVPQPTAQVLTSDSVSISSSTQKKLSAKEGSSKESEPKKTERKSDDIADKLNEVSKTKVKFQFASAGAGGADIRFQILDKESGEVVREFPPDTINEIKEKIEDGDYSGIVINKTA